MKEEKLKIAIQGYEGSFHQIAAMAYYDTPVKVVPSRSFSDLIVHTAQNDGGVMAIENSIAGSILPNYNLLQESDLSVTGELYLRIQQNLMALPGQTIDDIKEVHSHPMAIMQCRSFFKQHPHIKLVETEDTALSARHIAEGEISGTGAIASLYAAELFGLEVIEESIETVKNNYTRFLVLSNEPSHDIAPGHNKASISFNAPHETGSLAKTLQLIAAAGVNLSKIQSFPVLGSEWQYHFHVDMEFEKPAYYLAAIADLKNYTKALTVLGTYKKGKTI